MGNDSMSEQPDRETCLACQEELALAHGGTAALDEPALRHLGACADCEAFAAIAAELAATAAAAPVADPPAGLVARTLARLEPELESRAWTRTRDGRRVGWRLALAGAVSLPVIVAVNLALGMLGHSLLGRWLAAPVADAFAGVLGLTTLLGLSLAYGALPLLANWAVDVRQPLVPAPAVGLTFGPEATSYAAGQRRPS